MLLNILNGITMKIDKITESNKLIAKFMGLIFDDGNWIQKDKLPERYYAAFETINEAKYHNDWNWLMPVVNKIHSQN